IKDYFFAFIEDLNAGWGEPQSKQNAVNRLKQIAAQAKALEAGGNVAAAESVIARALPPLGLLA
ncbi:MAG: nucleotidyltransferase, partial [Coriobacteriia bacterium]|nr:nucleotidyltransferase [Coriobacteriia bacterium]